MGQPEGSQERPAPDPVRAHRIFSKLAANLYSGVDCDAGAQGESAGSSSACPVQPSQASSSCPVVSASGEALHPLTNMPMALYSSDAAGSPTAATSGGASADGMGASQAKRSWGWWSWSRGQSANNSSGSSSSTTVSSRAADTAVPGSKASTSDSSTSAAVETPGLGTVRQRSTIPMAAPPDKLPPHQQGVYPGAGQPAQRSCSGNTGALQGSTPEQGGTTQGEQRVWMYPSEQMFYNAMKRKGWQPEAKDMGTVVAIHNAVNERAWSEVKAWEALHCDECPQGPRLVKFQGKPSEYSPKARLLNFLGYALPFDRHDWIVDRCGKQVRYVIDFYSGRPLPGGPPAAMFLDTRPALDSIGAVWDRARMTGCWLSYTLLWHPTPTPASSSSPSPSQQLEQQQLQAQMQQTAQ